MNDFFRRSAVTKAWVDTRPHVYDMISAWFAERAKLARAERAKLARKAAR
jgi:hypothetical protein